MKLLSGTAALLFCSMLSNAVLADDWLYTIRPGDTLEQICAEYLLKDNCRSAIENHNAVTGDVPAGTVIKIPVQWLNTPPQPALAEYVRGDVRIKRNTAHPGKDSDASLQKTEASAANGTPLAKGSELGMGDTIITGVGTALIRFADDSNLILKSNSVLKMERLTTFKERGIVDTNLRLSRGSAVVRVKPGEKTRYRISTPSAIAAVRGTVFRISSSPQEGEADVMRNEVLRGEVAVSAQGSEQGIKGGFGTVAIAGQAPLPPQALLEAPQPVLGEQLLLPTEISWPAIAGASSYIVEVYEDEGLQKLIASYASPRNSFELPTQAKGKHSLVFAAVDKLGLAGKQSAHRVTFTYKRVAPALSIRADTMNNKQLSLDWPAVSNASHYLVEASDSADFRTLSYEQETDTPGIDIPTSSDKPIYVRAKSVYDDGNGSDYSEVIESRTQPRALQITLSVIAGLLFFL